MWFRRSHRGLIILAVIFFDTVFTALTSEFLSSCLSLSLAVDSNENRLCPSFGTSFDTVMEEEADVRGEPFSLSPTLDREEFDTGRYDRVGLGPGSDVSASVMAVDSVDGLHSD